MPHISKKRVHKEMMEKILRRMFLMFKKAEEKNLLGPVINEILTKTEQIMIAKRLSIILLLSRQIPQHHIVDVLNVSPSTVSKASLDIERGKFNSIIKTFEKKKIDIEKLIANILFIGGIVPPIPGKKYWKKVLNR